ncbi:PIN domain-containing protein [Corynebacterium gottingense]|uniref:PIN domain-containing protein n=1 Tax=Corynebacterium gottingense TaxID=2041036 RepID=UPI0038CFE335
MPQRVFVDANVLASRTILDWLFALQCLSGDMFVFHTSQDVLAEAVRVLRRKCPTAPGKLVNDRVTKVRAVMEEIVRDFPGDIAFDGLDRDDYHVHAAAVASRADIVLTDNSERDITTSPHLQHYEILNADDFLMLVHDSAPHLVLKCTKQQLDYWQTQKNFRGLDKALKQAGCPNFANAVREALKVLARQ